VSPAKLIRENFAAVERDLSTAVERPEVKLGGG
jgi:hypothetical protein